MYHDDSDKRSTEADKTIVPPGLRVAPHGAVLGYNAQCSLTEQRSGAREMRRRQRDVTMSLIGPTNPLNGPTNYRAG